VSGIEQKPVPASAPAGFSLEANYPNPFNAATVIPFKLAAGGRVRVEILDSRGRLVRTLEDGLRAAGRHTVEWTGVDAGGQPVSSGIYFVRVHAEGGFTATGKMILLR